MTITSPSVGLNAATGAVLTGWEHVLQSLSDIFTTGFGERIIREWYGSFVPNLLGQLITPDEVTPFFVAITSAIPALSPHAVIIAVGLILILTMANLRGTAP